MNRNMFPKPDLLEPDLLDQETLAARQRELTTLTKNVFAQRASLREEWVNLHNVSDASLQKKKILELTDKLMQIRFGEYDDRKTATFFMESTYESATQDHPLRKKIEAVMKHLDTVTDARILKREGMILKVFEKPREAWEIIDQIEEIVNLQDDPRRVDEHYNMHPAPKSINDFVGRASVGDLVGIRIALEYASLPILMDATAVEKQLGQALVGTRASARFKTPLFFEQLLSSDRELMAQHAGAIESSRTFGTIDEQAADFLAAIMATEQNVVDGEENVLLWLGVGKKTTTTKGRNLKDILTGKMKSEFVLDDTDKNWLQSVTVDTLMDRLMSPVSTPPPLRKA